MRIAQLLEFQKEDFRQMSQQASNIQQGNGAVDSATQRQQRIAQLAANQQARNAAPPGRSQTPPATQSTSAVTQTAPVNLTATPQDTGASSTTPATAQQQNAPMDPTLAQNLPGQEPPKTSFAQKIGGLAKGVGAVAGGVAGIGRAIKKGYNAGANAVGGPGYAQSGAGGASAGGSGGSAGGGAGGGTGGNYDDEIANLKSTIQQMDQRLRRVGAE
jgi:hypothetical protein